MVTADAELNVHKFDAHDVDWHNLVHFKFYTDHQSISSEVKSSDDVAHSLIDSATTVREKLHESFAERSENDKIHYDITSCDESEILQRTVQSNSVIVISNSSQ